LRIQQFYPKRSEREDEIVKKVLQMSEPKHLATVFEFALRDAGGEILVDEVQYYESLCHDQHCQGIL
jgi:hypothetical protein